MRRPGGLALVTQNVDGLHQKAGSRAVIELHGNIWRVRCAGHPHHLYSEEQTRTLEANAQGAVVPRCPCGAALRPDVVWFGEALDQAHIEAAVTAVRAADILLVAGTSSVVYPATALPDIAREAGALVASSCPNWSASARLASRRFQPAAGCALTYRV